jgi:hypothetical protein
LLKDEGHFACSASCVGYAEYVKFMVFHVGNESFYRCAGLSIGV